MRIPEDRRTRTVKGGQKQSPATQIRSSGITNGIGESAFLEKHSSAFSKKRLPIQTPSQTSALRAQ